MVYNKVMLELRQIILDRLEQLDRSRYWLANQAQAKGLANRETVFRYLRGERDTSATVAAGLLEILGLEIRPRARRGKGKK